MIIKIDKTDRDIVEKTCATLTYEVKFYTIENNKLLIQAEILDMGQEISLASAFRIGRMVGMEKLHVGLFGL